jgi:hypothetical protein
MCVPPADLGIGMFHARKVVRLDVLCLNYSQSQDRRSMGRADAYPCRCTAAFVASSAVCQRINMHLLPQGGLQQQQVEARQS